MNSDIQYLTYSGTNIGAEIAKATLSEGDAAERKEPSDTELLATKIIVRQHIIYLSAELFKLHIQYTIVVNINGNIIYLGICFN